jgi:hypothetical protein
MLPDMHFFSAPDPLTRIAAMVNMSAGAFELLRRITTCLVLAALAGIYAMPLAAVLSADAMECCTAGMCPMPGRGMSHHQTREEMPDCDGMGAARGAMRKCDMGATNTQKVQAVSVGLFVLSAPIRIVQSSVQVPLAVVAPQLERAFSSIPETPPPRTFLS